MIYFDACYVVRLYIDDPGWQVVRAFAATDHLACALHGRAETVAAFHRKLREGALTRAEFRTVLDQFEVDCAAGAIAWLPLSLAVVDRATRLYRILSRTHPLRSADALHLACAAENRFREVYSNDRRLLASAVHFRLRGVDLI
ncbi:MAG: type II toxin-antitoxin system VapC family toxin [Pedosphaera parvula]|nr:type II toxin-antitoxin system VapC family toxin [Planctomycetota bacterium]MBI3191283.1 type II toxin-antitoxin system VapC family toxin [Pedosphaera parvula]